MAVEDVSPQIRQFIRERFLDGDLRGELKDDTPLLELGVLNSMNIALLLSFLRDELGAAVGPAKVNPENFRDVRSISAMTVDILDGANR